MTESDLSTFKNLFKEYVEHVSANPHSLLARIYGIYTVKMAEIVPIHVILMRNTKKTINDKTTLKHIFDLKGSLVNREVKEKNGRPH
jgi:hypothetical protein